MSTNANNKGSIIYGILAFSYLAVVTTLCFIPIFIIGLLKLIPSHPLRMWLTQQIDRVAVIWTGLTTGYVNRFYPNRIHIKGKLPDNPKQWYLVIANHQSAVDTILIQNIFHRKIPVIKFFIKAQLKWIPLLGFAWWAMGCPFMKRNSKEQIKKNSHKKNKDIRSTDKALKLFKSYPSTIMSFIEGTRYTEQKKQHQQSPYKHLLKPKAGGISQVISALGTKLQTLVDVTFVYSTPKHSIWQFLCGRVDRIDINIRALAIPETFTQSTTLLEDSDMQNAFRAWLNGQWEEKDALISKIKSN